MLVIRRFPNLAAAQAIAGAIAVPAKYGQYRGGRPPLGLVALVPLVDEVGYYLAVDDVKHPEIAAALPGA